MRDVVEVLKRNSNIRALLDEFKKDFENTYYSLNDVQKENMIYYRDTIFRKWLYSPLREGSYITPNYIVNNIAQQKHSGDYSITPYVKVTVGKDNKLKFRNRFIYYSKDTSPVVEDLEKILSYASPTIIERDDNLYLIENGEKIVEKLNITSDYYIEYLIELAARLNALESMKSIGCRCYKIGKGYEEYINFDNETKIRLIIEKSIEMASEKISEIIESKKENFIVDFLDNGVTQETYFRSMESSVSDAMDFVENISDYTDNEEEILNITVARAMLGDEIGYWIVRREAGIYLDTNLTCIFGYYLGIISPIYEDLFLSKLFMEYIEYTDSPMDRVAFLFSMERGHNLTKFGESIMKYYKEELKGNDFKALISGNIKGYIEEYIKQKSRILDQVDNDNRIFSNNLLNKNSISIKYH